MHHLNTRFLSIAVLIFVLSSCTSKDQLKTILVENPEILVEAIQRNPTKFAPLFNQISGQARQIAQAQAQQQEGIRREEEFKNPKTPIIDTEKPFKGKANAPVTIVAYSDFQCPYCAKAEDAMRELMKKNEGKIRYVFKHFPLKMHPFAFAAALRYEAIAKQSKELALKYHDELFKNQPQINTEKETYLDKAAAKIGANVAKMKKDITSGDIANRVNADMEEGKKFGVTGTPAYMINGVFINGLRSVQEYDSLVQRWLSSRDVSSAKK